MLTLNVPSLGSSRLRQELGYMSFIPTRQSIGCNSHSALRPLPAFSMRGCPSGCRTAPRLPGAGPLAANAGSAASARKRWNGQRTICDPNSTTRLDGILKKAVALLALRNIATKTNWRQ